MSQFNFLLSFYIYLRLIFKNITDRILPRKFIFMHIKYDAILCAIKYSFPLLFFPFSLREKCYNQIFLSLFQTEQRYDCARESHQSYYPAALSYCSYLQDCAWQLNDIVSKKDSIIMQTRINFQKSCVIILPL